jgi:hypothetical protein
MTSRTIFLSRLLGLVSLIFATSMMVDRTRALQMVHTVLANPSATTLLGGLGLVAGLAIVLGHQIWRGGALPVAVTVLGWVIFLRGVLLLCLPAGAGANLLRWVDYDGLFYACMALAGIVGLYLAIQGFSRRQPATRRL